MCDEQRPKLVFSELDRLPCIFFCRWGNRNGIIGRDRPEHRSRGAIKNKYFMDLGSQTHAASDFLLIFLGCVFKEMVFLRNVWQWGDLPHFPAVMYGCESWTVKKAEHRRIDAFWTVVLEKTLENPLDCKEIQPDHSKGDQSWVFFGRTDAKAETPVLWPPHAKSWLIGKDSDAGRDWGQEEKGMTEDEMAGWHHWLDGREFEWTPGVGDG